MRRTVSKRYFMSLFLSTDERDEEADLNILPEYADYRNFSFISRKLHIF